MVNASCILYPVADVKNKPSEKSEGFGRVDRIRTCGLCVPNAALYQAEPQPEIELFNYTDYNAFCQAFLKNIFQKMKKNKKIIISDSFCHTEISTYIKF